MTAERLTAIDAEMMRRIYEVKARCQASTAEPIAYVRFRCMETVAGLFGIKWDQTGPRTGNFMLGVPLEEDPTLRGSEFYFVTKSGARFGERFMDVSE